MKVLSSLRSRIFLTTVLLAVLSMGIAIYIVSESVTREAENALQREIVATGDLVQQLRTTRADTYTMLANLIADAPKVKAAIDTKDPSTVQMVLDEYPSQLRSDLMLVTNKSGAVLATVGASSRTASIVANQPSVRDALAGHPSFSLLPQPDGMLQLVTVPITIGPETLGTLSVGFLLDDTLAAQLKQVTGSEIAFGMDGQVLAATLPAEDRVSLSALLRREERSRSVTLGSEEFAALPIPLSGVGDSGFPGAGPVALVLRSRTETLRFLRSIRRQFAVTLVFAVVLATLFSFAVARTITKPLADITDVMREVAATGDLTKKIVFRGSQRWNDEDATLLATTFNTLTDSVTRFQREISQKERLSSLGRLSTVIAHEVRNPLMIIKAALHTLGRPDLSRSALEEATADINDEIIRLNRIVNEVLDFARPIRFDLSRTDLNALCRESAEAAQATPGAPVYLDLDPTRPWITTDGERLRGALVNLIVNARHAVAARAAVAATGGGTTTAPLTPERSVWLSVKTGGEHATIVIADAGVGIDAADLPRVFDPYFTTKRGGTGLGLPIAKNVVEGLGGAIAVTSEVGRGTEIRIDLPVDRSDAERIDQAHVASVSTQAVAHGRAASIAAGPAPPLR
jgi:signal transduction histidine kinase